MEVDGDLIGGSTAALSRSAGHISGHWRGVIGLELGSVWSRLGAKVIVLEYQDRLMAGMMLS